LAVVVALVVLGPARAQTVDVVYYQERGAKKEQEHRGKIESEGPGGIKIKLAKREKGKDVVKEVPASAITWVYYYEVGMDRKTYRDPMVKEERARTETNPKKRADFLNEAVDLYRGVKDKLTSRPDGRRYMDFKMAGIKVLQAQSDSTLVDDAIKSLSDFKTAHPGGWEIMPALKMLAKLQEESGKVDDARKTYEELIDLPDVPEEIQKEGGVLVGKLLLRGGKYADAEKRLQKLATGLTKDDPQAPFVKAYLAESQLGQNNLTSAQKALTEVIATTSDARLRGLAYNLLGDYYRQKGQQDEAFWSYLRVDAQYNEDPEEQAKALYHLAILFDKARGNPLRGKEYLARLLDKRYAGTAFQRKAVSEGKKAD